MHSAYLLVSHGSSDPRHQAGLLRLANLTRQHLARSHSSHTLTKTPVRNTVTSAGEVASTVNIPTRGALRSSSMANRPSSPYFIVGTATLEATAMPLAQQIEVFAQRVMAAGIRRIVILPLFLLEGVHVQEDLPREVAAAQTAVSPSIRLVCAAYLGSHHAFQQFLATRLTRTLADRCLLLAHGSRRAEGNRSVQKLGVALDADVAFWSVPPDFETQVMQLMQEGYRQIAIVPYFLLPGGITDAITRRTEALAERWPKLSLRLLAPLGTSSELGRALATILLAQTPSLALQARDRWEGAENGITA